MATTSKSALPNGRRRFRSGASAAPTKIALLASDQAAFVTGQAIGIDGGW